MNYFAIINLVRMKKEAKDLVLKLYNTLKFAISHPDLNEIFDGAKASAKICCERMIEEFPDRKEKYETLQNEIEKLSSDITNFTIKK